MRLFFALDIGDDIRRRLTAYVDSLRHIQGIRFMPPETYHVTLKFLGEVKDRERAEQAAANVREGRVPIAFREVGCFPNARAPRIFWAGIHADERLARLAATLDEALGKAGFPREDRPFRPHLTLARSGSGNPSARGDARPIGGFRALAVEVEQNPPPEFGTMTASEFFLYESTLSPRGSKYTKLARFPLAAGNERSRMRTYAIVAVVAYLCGSIPFGYILVRLFLKTDVRQTGSGNIGATNVARTGAKGLAILTLLLDAVKGFVAVLFATLYVNHVTQPPNVDLGFVPAFAGLFAILGHLYPVWLKFRGGKGVATALGVFVGLAPTPVGIVLGLFAVVVLVTRYISLGSILAAAAFPFVVYLIHREQFPPAAYVLIGISSLLIIWRHRTNIRRLLTGTENRFPTGKATEEKA